MAKIRIGLGSEFNLNNSNLGLGVTNPQVRLDVDGTVKSKDFEVTGVTSFTAYEGFLRSDHQIDGDLTLNTGQGLNASLSGEIIVKDGVTVTVGAIGLGTTSVGVGTELITNTIDSNAVNLAGGSEIECLKVYDTFTPPSGGTNERPYAPKPGELYYNYDFKTIEFHDGYGWRQVDNTTRSGRAVFFGGYIGSGGTRTESMDLINISTLGNSINFGNLESARTDTQGCSDGTRGLCAGGYHPARLTDTEYVTLASAGNSIQFGDLAQARNAFGGCSSSTRGLFAGGATPNAGAPSELQIDYFQISTLGTALDFGDSATSRAGLSGGIPSSTRAVWGAGTNRVGNPSTVTAVTMMDYSTFASKGNAVEFGNEILSRTTGNGCSSGTRGVFAGGYGSGAIHSSPTSEEMGRKMSYITIASTGNAIEFGELSERRSYIGSNSTSTRGIWTGGSNYPTHYDSIEYVQFSSLGNALDFGNLHSTKGYMSGSASDSHGGLGGF